MKSVRILQVVFLSLVLLVLPIKMVGAFQQPNYPINFSLNPSVFPISSNVSTLACVTVPGPANAISIHQNDIFGLIFDTSIGTLSLPPSPTVTLVTTPVAPVVSPVAVAGDFTVALGTGNPNKLTIKYTNAATKNLLYGTNICTPVNIATAATPGTGMVRVGSPLSTLSGNLPTITVSLVDFPTSKGSYSFISASSIPSIGSYFAPLTGFGDPTGGNSGQGNGDGFAVAAAPMPTSCTFDSLQVSATTIGTPFPYVFTLWKNDSPTALTCGLTTDVGTNTVTCSDTTHTVSVVAGDMVATQVTQTGFTCCSSAGTFGISYHCK
jgi:hypothetical protein